MLIPTILVTISGLLETTDLELPGDVPVGELVPLLLEICGSQKNDPQALLQTSISLQIAGMNAPLPSEKTLIDIGVYDGTVLILQAKNTSSFQAERLTRQQFVPHSVQPSTSTGGIGVTWKTL